MKLGELIMGLHVRAAVPASPKASLHTVRICDITDDSRTVLPGSLFVARVGTKVDGRAFIAGAVAAGAAAILTEGDAEIPEGDTPVLIADDLPQVAAELAERFYGNPTSRLKLIGVTGTNGKTTIAHLVHQILRGAGVRAGLIGTVLVDDGVSAAPATLTTPPATELSRTFGVMVDAGCTAAVMETSSHALEQGRVAALKYDIAVFTNLTGDHLDYHGTMEAYAGAKAKLFTILPEDGWAIVNDEDPWTARMLEGCGARVLRCRVDAGDGSSQNAPETNLAGGPTCSATCRATVHSITMSGTHVTLSGPWGTFDAMLKLVGLHNVMNALQAAAACWAAGVSAPALAKQIASASAPPGRLEPVESRRDECMVLVDYAHTDDALRKVLEAIRPLVSVGIDHSSSTRPSQLCVLVGCGGDRDRTKRARMGAVAAELADVVFVTSDNPRTERPSDIVDEILVGVPEASRHKVQIEIDRARAIRKAIEQAQAGDVVLIAGKGHEDYQIVSDGRGGTIRHHFDDREVSRDVLADLREQRKAAAVP